MATLRWTGAATAVAQVDTFTPANVEVSDIFTLTATGLDGTSHAVNYTATATTVADVTAGLTAAWNTDTHALCTPVTAADGTTVLTLTADTAGVAFSVASSTTDGGGNDTQTLTRAATTASAGPKHWDCTDNWDAGILPGAASGHNVYIENFSGDILYGLDQSGIANTLTSLHIGQSFTGTIGVNGAAGESGTYLQIKATTVDIGYHYGTGSPSGSGRLMIDLGATASTVTVHNTGSNSDTGKPSARIKAASASTVINLKKGKLGIAFEADETSTVATINESYVTQKTSDADLFVGSGVTLTTLNKTGGDCDLSCAATTVTNYAGDLTTAGSGAITTLNVYGGTATCNSSGTITALNIKDSGTADFTKIATARTVTTAKIDPSGKIKYDPSIVTMTNHIQPVTSSGNIVFTATDV